MNTLFYKNGQEPGAKSQNGSKIIATCLFLLFSLVSFSQEKQQDTTKVKQLDEVLVSAVRVTSKTPVSFSNLDKKEIKLRNLGQDIPILMNYLPSVVTTSDAGNGVGYTGIRVRGSDATRVNVTINGQSTPIYIKGSADRIDKIGNVIRIIDYKSSIKSSDKFNFEGFEKLFTNSDYNKMLQLFMYAWLFVKKGMAKPEELMPCIIPFKKFEEKPRFINDNSKEKAPLVFTTELLLEFEMHLIQEINTMLDTRLNFNQTEDVKNCEYCAYSSICNIH